MNKQKKSVKGISCDEAIKRVFSFIDDHLQGKSRTELEHHLETCRHCFDRVEFERLLKSRMKELNANPPSDQLHKRIDALLEQF